MKNKIGNLLFALILLVFPLVLLLLGQFKWEYRTNVIMFPWIIGSLLMLTAVWLIIRAVILSEEKIEDEGETIGESDDPRSSLFKRLAWVACVYPLCYVLGMITGLLVYALAYTSYHRLPWWQRILSSVVVFLIVYVGFNEILSVPLPVSPVWMRG